MGIISNIKNKYKVNKNRNYNKSCNFYFFVILTLNYSILR